MFCLFFFKWAFAFLKLPHPASYYFGGGGCCPSPGSLDPNTNDRNNRCGYHSVTKQYLKKRCLIQDELNYMFRPNVAIIRFSSESMVVVLYWIGMGMSRWWDLSICDVCYMLYLRGAVGGGICDVRFPGVWSSSVSARCCPMWVSSYCLSISDVYLLVDKQ